MLAIVALMAIPASAADQSVTATPGNSFSPTEVTIDVGDKVTWENGGGFHNVKFDDGSFEEPAAPDFTGWSAARTFDKPGHYPYYCEAHGGPNGAGMSGHVMVRDADGTVPEGAPGLTVGAPRERRLSRLLDRGALEVKPRCENGCELEMKLTIAPKTAKRLGFRERRTTIGRSGEAVLPPGRGIRTDIELTRTAKRKLRNADRSFKTRLEARATKGTSETVRRTIAIKR